MADIYPQSISISGKTVTIVWSDRIKTNATASGGDKFVIEFGVLWALSKRFVSTSEIVNAVYNAKKYLNMKEGEMLWIIATYHMSEKEVQGVLDFASTL
jgi:hypothetical protein